MADTIAYFITWTTYGTWLPGDARGWTDWHTGWKTPDPVLESHARSIMTEQAVVLTIPQRVVVESTIDRHCELRNWKLWAKNCLQIMFTSSSQRYSMTGKR